MTQRVYPGDTMSLRRLNPSCVAGQVAAEHRMPSTTQVPGQALPAVPGPPVTKVRVEQAPHARRDTCGRSTNLSGWLPSRRSLLQNGVDRVPARGEAAPVTGSSRARPLACSRFEQAFQTARGLVE
jgi:hypothetical protein